MHLRTCLFNCLTPRLFRPVTQCLEAGLALDSLGPGQKIGSCPPRQACVMISGGRASAGCRGFDTDPQAGRSTKVSQEVEVALLPLSPLPRAEECNLASQGLGNCPACHPLTPALSGGPGSIVVGTPDLRPLASRVKVPQSFRQWGV